MTSRPTNPLCPDCGTYGHPPPRCGHDMTAPCYACGKPRGLRWTADDGSVGGRATYCWRWDQVAA